MQVYLVGGAVRDQLLNYPFHERDWVVVGATPDDLLKQGYQQVGKDFPVFLHPSSKEEYALARTEKKAGSGYHGFICDFGPEVTLEEDLQRRDLTINAMAMDDNAQLIDPYGGQRDLEQRLLRHVSPAFNEDPLRVLRVARFAARYAHLGFTLAPETQRLMHDMSQAGELATITPERLWVEINKGLATNTPSVFFKVLQDCGALNALYPAWSAALTEDLLAIVDAAAKFGGSNELRFAITCSALNSEQCEALCEQLKATNAAQDLALLGVQLLPLTPLNSAETVMALLEKLDYLRRPQRVSDFVQLAKTLNPYFGTSPAAGIEVSVLERAAQSLGNIRAETLIAEGLKGPALGKALRQKRLDALSELLGKPA
ncbi:hypothetical protein IB286_06295 [Spongiibacter sp. KMU-158]|uniref:CCA-adding enzyme n=1 Tax=Spongiibacter pelagi TaxID=2760804 RepID=A0A927GVF6_9GAMM|nr:hypothetical protein [Spongiibacter pelagi]MBD2858616.1 hypothetical protein [Spongiibacter pelagi]